MGTYDRLHGYLFVDAAELQKKLSLLQSGIGQQDPKQFVQGLLETSLPAFERDVRELQRGSSSAARRNGRRMVGA